MNSPGQICRWTRSIAHNFSGKRRAMQNRGYYLMSLPERLIRSSPEFIQNCSIVQCNQKRFIAIRPDSWFKCKNELRQSGDVSKNNENKLSIIRKVNLPKNFCTTSSLPATAAFTTHGEGEVDMDSKEFIQNLETYSRYQPCPVSIGNLFNT